MPTLSVWKFATADGADDAGRTLTALHEKALLTVHDAAVVSWETGAPRPRTRSLDDSVGALGGAFWGLLLGLIFFVPLLGAAIGLATAALSASLKDVGTNESFIERVRGSVTPGTSALFVLSSDAVIDAVREAFDGTEMELIETNLSEGDEAALRSAFGRE